MQLSESALPLSPVTTVMAVDADASDNGRVVYGLKGEGSEAFQVDSETGEITVSRSIKRPEVDFSKVKFVLSS